MTSRTPTGRTWALAPIFLSLVIMFGCQEESESTGARPPTIIRIVDSAIKPATYRLADPDCQGRSQPVDLTRTTIASWHQAAVDEVAVSVSGFISDGTSITTPAVQEVTWGDVYLRQCDLSRPPGKECANDSGVEKGWYTESSRGGLRICRDDHNYGRDTYEGVALTSLTHLQNAFDRYRLLSGMPAPERIRVSVLPEFNDLYANYRVDGQDLTLKTWVTHNLAYFPQRQLLVVFPERASLQASATGFFWESAFVLAHEYGHHIDASRVPTDTVSVALEWVPTMHRVVDTEALAMGLAGASNRAQVDGAVAEAFADLSAWYTVGVNSDSFIAIEELGVDRNVASATFADGTAKIMTDEALGAFLTAEPQTGSGGPNFHDIHITGAVLARTLDEVFARVGQDPAREDGGDPAVDLARRYRLLLGWLDAVKPAVRALPLDSTRAEAVAPLNRAIQTAIDSELTRLPLTGGDDATLRLRRDVCDLVRTRLPAAGRAPYGAADGGCGAD